MNPILLPKQGGWLNKRVSVELHRNVNGTDGQTAKEHYGFVVRNDATGPFHTIIKLDDGTLIMGSECDFHHAPSAPKNE